ncbi:uncharacterized protein PFB0765w-like isoform X2 [Aricia agestis]|uniref:uncharacterized protein PFB0765w-like isoform X2 n=1 Tax=Aricia agestis TaxID=91739 RepID=UPI001C20BB5E|nr:uncharacterized protein PFB0765w-like isoform X2 [Aricia agestis]
MTDSKEVQALESIASAVDESQLKIILTTQCIKAQSLLVTKLRKQSDHQKEVCNFINNGNLKLETEIRIAEQKIKSSITALETIKTANVELQKDLFLSKERKSDILERVKTGIKKYEDMWQEAKTKYENIPFIKHYLETKNLTITIKQNIDHLINDSQKLNHEINEKKMKLANQDRKLVIELANYLVNERPKTLLLIQEKSEKIKELNKAIKDSNEDINATLSEAKIDKSISKLNANRDSTRNQDDADSMLPKLELSNIDFDLLTDKLNKIKKCDSFNSKVNVINQNQSQLNTQTERDAVASTVQNNDYKMILIDNNLNTPKNYSEKKLIHILDDIKINENETKEILANVKKNSLRDVNVFEVISPRNADDSGPSNTVKEDKKLEELEEIDSTPKPSSLIGPPSQFLDVTEGTQKNETMEVDTTDTSIKELDTSNKDDEGDIELVKSGESDRSFEKIKDTILKKHKLDLSPQFVYTKKPMVQSTKSEIKSKFFDDKKETQEEANLSNNTSEIIEIVDKDKEEPNNVVKKSPKQNEQNTEKKDNMAISGFLFNHGADGIVQLSNTSLDTTGYGGDENDFPHCIDSSLLLSPKADLDEQDNPANNVQVSSQEVPNFLTGLRKTGFSFFGPSTPDEASTSGNKTQQSNFNFNFGGDEKKSRGGLFSMFR